MRSQPEAHIPGFPLAELTAPLSPVAPLMHAGGQEAATQDEAATEMEAQRGLLWHYGLASVAALLAATVPGLVWASRRWREPRG